MRFDRWVGVLCLGLAGVAVTWGSDTVWRSGRDSARPAPRPATQRGATAPAPAASAATTAAGPSSSTAPGVASTTSTTRVAARPTATTATTAGGLRGEAARALARRALLVPADLPPGFATVRPAPDGAEPDPDSPFKRCLGADAAPLAATVGAEARSAHFAQAEMGTVSSTSAVFDQPVSAEKVIGILASRPARSCFETLINARLARNPNLSEDVRGSLSPIDPGPVGDQATGFRFEVRLPADDVEDDPNAGNEPVPYLADFIFVRRGQTLALLEFANLRQPFPTDGARAIAANLAGHF